MLPYLTFSELSIPNLTLNLTLGEPFDSWHTLGASAQSRCRKIQTGVEIGENGVDFWPWRGDKGDQRAANLIRN